MQKCMPNSHKIQKIMSKKIVKLIQEENWTLVNILNEVLHGLRVNNFEQKIGDTKENALQLMEKLKSEKNNASFELEYPEQEILIFRNSFKEVLRQIEEWEFQTRIGITIPEVQAIISKFLC